LDSLRSQTVEVFPFTVYHASNVLHRRYTLFVISDGLRQRWRTVFEDAMGLYRARQEANMVSLIQNNDDDMPNSVTSGIILVLCRKVSSGSLGQKRREKQSLLHRSVSDR